MKWLVASLVTVLCLAGCHAPKPSFNVLAPYGPSRVPPPSTSGQAPSGPYYNGTNLPTTTVPANPNSSGLPSTSQKTRTNTSSHNSHLAAADSWKPVRTKSTADPAPVFPGTAGLTEKNQVLPVSYKGSDKTEEAGLSAQGKATLRWNGTPVTDLTTGASLPEPARFVPPTDAIEISQLPPASNSSTASGTVVSSSKASDHIQPNVGDASANKTTLTWRSRSPGN